MILSQGSRLRKVHAGTFGWLGLAAYVGAYDLYAINTKHETLTSAFGRMIDHPAKRLGVVAAWLYVTYHLFSGARP